MPCGIHGTNYMFEGLPNLVNRSTCWNSRVSTSHPEECGLVRKNCSFGNSKKPCAGVRKHIMSQRRNKGFFHLVYLKRKLLFQN